MQQPRYHIICDLTDCKAELNSQEVIRQFLEEVVKRVNMHILEGPMLSPGIPENPGISGVILVDFSHIAVHTFTKHNETLIDIFSCKPFERNPMVDYCCEFFGADRTTARIKEVWWG